MAEPLAVQSAIYRIGIECEVGEGRVDREGVNNKWHMQPR